MKPVSKSVGKACVLATVVAVLALLPSSVFATDSTDNMDTTQTTAATTTTATSTAKTTTKRTPSSDPVEMRIKELHDKLKITDAQNDLWNAVTKEMRDHAKMAQDLIGTRNQNATQMTALDDLKSYAEIAQVHADGMKQFLAVFTPLYTAMSDAQKKNADDAFREHKDMRAKKHQTALKHS